MAFHDLFYEIIASKCVFHTISISWQFEKEMSSHHITTVYQSWNFISHIAATYITLWFRYSEWIPNVHFFVDFI